MLQWFQALMPREGRFFELFNRHAETIVQGAGALRELLKGGSGVPDACRRIMDYETQADAITRDVLLLMHRSFITPLDRGDINDLIGALDDSIDQMQKTAKAIMRFEVKTLEPEMQQMGDSIVKAAALTQEAVRLMGAMRENSTRLNQITNEIIHLEDSADDMNERGIKALYLKYRDGNAMGYIVGVEIYDHLEKVMDRFEDVANRISGILIEHV